ncbi:acyl-CoA dehydrogenase family protein [Streptomyces sp. UNOB3_S3]|uniref:acyl-CoA dehydrogenase family protein n=1 Tax=Streptomyces sp. UNOB3_S3 TaxID=2871682 RepID=UPI001E453BD5|nr:acyl-CoA dehydrogenase family protein [Streptomyces sp. UNOB3_S3]MCC3774632.1 acyl-CoA/acyl-ACP dehydrogenase [Streptomyces sp. UNOB3_S3]
MDFTFTEEQQAAAEAARAVLGGVSADGVPSPALVTGPVAEDFDRPLWRRLADADLLSLLLPEERGGAGLGPIALCLVLREAGRVLARVPLLETSAAAFVLGTYGDAATGPLLDAIGRGELVVTTAAQGRTGHDAPERAVTARQDSDGHWLLDGQQTAVPWAPTADRILLPAHAGNGRTVLALVPPGRPGVTLDDQVSTNGERYARVTLDAVRMGADETVTADGGWERLRELLTVGTCALALGVGEAAARMTSDYTSKREQFGFPLATFQAVAVQCADRYIDLRAMEATLLQAAWRIEISTGSGETDALPVAADIAVAKVWASEGVRRVVQTAQHLHGGFGADTEYALHRYHAWAKQLELSLGPAAAHEEALGDLLAAHPLS